MPLHDLFASSQNRVVKVDAKLGNSITPFRPSILNVVVVGNCLLEFMKKTVQLCLSQIRLAESLLKPLISDLFKCHHTSSRANSNNLSIVTDKRQELFCEFDSSIKILNKQRFTVWKVHLMTSESKASPLAATPALLTSTSILPYFYLTKPTKSSMLLKSETSSFYRCSWAWGCLLEISPLAFSPSSRLRTAIMMFHPCFPAKFSTIP